MIAEIRSGLQGIADGVLTTFRADKTGAGVVTMAHGGYTEAAVRGTIMEVANAVAGIAPGTVLAVAPPIALWNPPSSGKNLSILKASMGYVSGTLGGGSVLLAAVLSQTTVPTTGTELVPLCSMLGMPRGVGRAFAGSTFVSVPQIIRPIFTMGAFLLTTPVQPCDTVDVLDGSIVVPPGVAICMQAIAAAGTSPLVCFGFTWEEIPV